MLSNQSMNTLPRSQNRLDTHITRGSISTIKDLKDLEYSIYNLKSQLALSNAEKQKLQTLLGQNKGQISDEYKKLNRLELDLNKRIEEVDFWKKQYETLKNEKNQIMLNNTKNYEQTQNRRFEQENRNREIDTLLTNHKSQITGLQSNLQEAHDKLTQQNNLISGLKSENTTCLNKIEELNKNMINKLKEIQNQNQIPKNNEEMKKLHESIKILTLGMKSLQQENKLLLNKKDQSINELKNEINNLKSTKISQYTKSIPTSPVRNYKVRNYIN